MTATDYRTAFEHAPIGLVISRDRLMVACNQQLLAMFGAEHDSQFAGRSFELLYPTHEEFERTGARIVASLDRKGFYADERIMKRLSGELFWCHVSGRALDPKRPHADGIWSFEDLSARRKVSAVLTPRERDRRAADRGPHVQACRSAAGHQPAHRRRVPCAPDAQVRRLDHT
jgi:PAS domain S-box-containing protein